MPPKRASAPTPKPSRIARAEAAVLQLVLEEYITYLRAPWRVFTANFLAGLARGLGFMLGATVLVAILVALFAWLATMPFVGEWFRWMADRLATPIPR